MSREGWRKSRRERRFRIVREGAKSSAREGAHDGGRAMIDFWVSIGSTYSYLTVMRLDTVEEETRVKFRWRPFSVRAIMIEQNNIPFIGKPVKLAYMWRDIERRAQARGLEPRLPAPYPLKEFDLANRVAMVGEGEGWCANYIRAVYRHWVPFRSRTGVRARSLRCAAEIGQHPARVVELAKSEAVGERYREATAEAKALGVFGSPTFVVDGEVFWGDDRLEDALRWREGGPAAYP
jgi:2-hydroxychromene-2-carboxylate isomerase